MIVVTARLRCKPGQESELMEVARASVAASRAEEGCVSYAFLSDLDEASEFMFVEEWADADALRRHMASEHMKTFLADVRPHVEHQEVRLHTVEKSRTL